MKDFDAMKDLDGEFMHADGVLPRVLRKWLGQASGNGAQPRKQAGRGVVAPLANAYSCLEESLRTPALVGEDRGVASLVGSRVDFVLNCVQN